jgi:hypothetical protein
MDESLLKFAKKCLHLPQKAQKGWFEGGLMCAQIEWTKLCFNRVNKDAPRRII